MNVLHVTPAYYPATYWGGPIISVYGLCNSLAKIPGLTLKVLTTDSAGINHSDSVTVSDFPMRYPQGYEVYFCRRWWAESFAPSIFSRLLPMVRWADVVHLTGVYSSPTIPTLLICRMLGKPIVWSPRGALQRWEGSTKPIVKEVWEWLCNSLIQPGRCFLHVTSTEEAADSVKRIPKAIIKLIPNGVKIPKTLPKRVWMPDGKLRLLYIGRLHPIKGIENLLMAIKLLAENSLCLEIYGNGDDAYSISLQQLVKKFCLEKFVSFHGHVNDEEKSNVFMNADVCVVPSFSENFGMVVAEALANGVPVIASKGTPWAELINRNCGFWVENSPSALARTIKSISGERLEDMGRRGREWMKQEFSWESVASEMYKLYKMYQ